MLTQHHPLANGDSSDSEGSTIAATQDKIAPEKEEETSGEQNDASASEPERGLLQRTKSQSVTVFEVSNQTEQWNKKKAETIQRTKILRQSSLDISNHRALRGKNISAVSLLQKMQEAQASPKKKPLPQKASKSLLKVPILKASAPSLPLLSSDKKSVRFELTDKGSVFCDVKMVRKISSKYHKVLWWNTAELDERYDRDTELAALVEGQYAKILEKAYSSTSTAEDETSVDLCFTAMQGCAIARGLEGEVFPTLYDRKMDHRKAVLFAQSFLGGDLTNGTSAQFLRQQSLKFSRASHLVANKVGLFDQRAAQ